jgi:hypothetical protein
VAIGDDQDAMAPAPEETPCPMCNFVDGTPVSLFAASLLLGITPGSVRALAERLHLAPHYMRRSPHPRLYRVFFVHELHQLRAALAPPIPRRPGNGRAVHNPER